MDELYQLWTELIESGDIDISWEKWSAQKLGDLIDQATDFYEPKQVREGVEL